jgi:hypothetical protein
MGSLTKEAAEQAIARVLLEQWDPLGVRFAPGEHADYARYAHELYGLLLRGGSDVQVERFLRHAVHADMNRPEPPEGEYAAVVRALREVERKM